ncbi:MAG: hypothetical protein Q7R50_01350 [Dehalococcoidales bacterium]|nr:hypothetical protein [Dehalococcoidales bacterium]
MWAYNVSITSELYFKVNQYLSDEIPLFEFEDWFYANLGELVGLPPSNELVLAGEIQLGLSELGNEDITEGQFRKNLAMVQHNETYIISGTPSITSVSAGVGTSGTIVTGDNLSDDSIILVPNP